MCRELDVPKDYKEESQKGCNKKITKASQHHILLKSLNTYINEDTMQIIILLTSVDCVSHFCDTAVRDHLHNNLHVLQCSCTFFNT